MDTIELFLQPTDKKLKVHLLDSFLKVGDVQAVNKGTQNANSNNNLQELIIAILNNLNNYFLIFSGRVSVPTNVSSSTAVRKIHNFVWNQNVC